MTQPATCSHGREGFCHDDATPEQRAAFDEAHRLAYAWAIGAGVERDEAEAFAGEYAQREYLWLIEDWANFPSAWAAREVAAGRRPDLSPKPYVPSVRLRRNGGRAA